MSSPLGDQPPPPALYRPPHLRGATPAASTQSLKPRDSDLKPILDDAIRTQGAASRKELPPVKRSVFKSEVPEGVEEVAHQRFPSAEDRLGQAKRVAWQTDHRSGGVSSATTSKSAAAPTPRLGPKRQTPDGRVPEEKLPEEKLPEEKLPLADSTPAAASAPLPIRRPSSTAGTWADITRPKAVDRSSRGALPRGVTSSVSTSVSAAASSEAAASRSSPLATSTKRRELPVVTQPSFLRLSRYDQNRLPFRQVHLGADPVHPTRDNNLMDIDEGMRWAAAFPQRDQVRVMEKLVQSVTRISHAEFLTHLESAADECAELLNGEDFMILAEPNKSNQWVAELALPTLDGRGCRPSCAIALRNRDSSNNFHAFLSREVSLGNEEGYLPSNIVLFDDGTFSGQQMSTFVAGILETYRTFDISIPKVIVVCPYATDVGKQRILEVGASFDCSEQLHFISRKRIPLLSQIFTKPEREILTQTFWPGEKDALAKEEAILSSRQTTSERRWSLEESFRAGPFSRGSIYFAHKIPNAQSFVLAMEHGYVYDKRGRLCNGRLDRSVDPPQFTAKRADLNFSIIPPTPPPYKRG